MKQQTQPTMQDTKQPDTLAHFVHNCQPEPPIAQCGHAFGGDLRHDADGTPRCAVCVDLTRPGTNCAHCGAPLWKTTTT